MSFTLPSSTQSTRYRPILAALLVLMVGLLLNGNRHVSGALGATNSRAAGSVLLGVSENGVPWDLAGLHAFEQDAGKQAAIVNWYWSWQDTLTEGGPDLALLRPISDRGSVPMISWAPQDYHYGVEQPNYNLGVIASGRYDGYVRQWGERLAAYGRPVLLRWAWEMNGNWMPWGMGVNGNTPAQYVAAWRHLHDLFAAAGASNVQWVWSPNIVAHHDLPLESLFPGDGYVDWVALDGYNRVSAGWQSFTDVFSSTYQRITALSTRRVMIAETSSSEAEGDAAVSKAQWITNALTQELPASFPRVDALLWFNEDKTGIETPGYDYRIESSAAARGAFAAAVSSPLYASTWRYATAPATTAPVPASPSATASATSTPSASRPATPAAGTSAGPSSSFVSANGTSLLLQGQPWRFTGYNVYGLASLATPHAYACGKAYSDAESGVLLDQMRSASGATVLRAWFFQSFGGPGNWTAFDRVLSQAAQRGIKVIPTLVNQWSDCEPAVNGQPGYKSLAWYQGGYKQAGDGYPLAYRDYVAAVTAHYANDPTIAFWQLVNEAEAFNGPAGGCDEATAVSTLRGFADDVAGVIKAADHNHLVSLGTIGDGQCGASGSTDYRYVHAGAVDLCEYHDYHHNTQPMPGDQWNGLQVRINDCKAVGKPLFVGEIGILANVQPSGVESGPVTSTTLTQRASFLVAKVKAQFNAGVAGTLIWSKGLTSTSYDIGPGDPAEAALQRTPPPAATAAQPAASPAATAVQPTSPPTATTTVRPTPSPAPRGSTVTPGPTATASPAPTTAALARLTATPPRTVSPTPSPSSTAAAPPNLLQNGAFTAGGGSGSSLFSPWWLEVKSGAAATLSADPGTAASDSNAARVSVTQSSADWRVQLFQHIATLTGGTTYTLSFRARAAAPEAVTLVLQQSPAPYRVYFQKTFNVTTNWQQFSVGYTPSTATDADTLFLLNLGAATGTVWLDSASLSRH